MQPENVRQLVVFLVCNIIRLHKHSPTFVVDDILWYPFFFFFFIFLNARSRIAYTAHGRNHCHKRNFNFFHVGVGVRASADRNCGVCLCGMEEEATEHQREKLTLNIWSLRRKESYVTSHCGASSSRVSAPRLISLCLCVFRCLWRDFFSKNTLFPHVVFARPRLSARALSSLLLPSAVAAMKHFDCCISVSLIKFLLRWDVNAARVHVLGDWCVCVSTMQWHCLWKYRLQSARITMCEAIS